MDWTLSETIALASEHCVRCQGFGMHRGVRGHDKPCECVFREIFRVCFDRFRQCIASQAHIPPAHPEQIEEETNAPPDMRIRNEEYIADFCGVSRRALDPKSYDLFRYHYLLGADWDLIEREIHVDRRTAIRHMFHIERRLGRVFRELKPYSLYPLDEYFGVVIRKSQKSNPDLEALLRSSYLLGSPRADLRKIA